MTHSCIIRAASIASCVVWSIRRVEGNSFHWTSPSPAVVPFLKEYLVVGVQHPVVRLAILPTLGWEFHEAFVQRKVVSNGVSPPLIFSVPVVGKILGDKVVDAIESEPLFLTLLDRHGYQRHVAVRRLDVQHLFLAVVRVDFVESDRSSGHRRNRLGGCLGVLAHRQRLFQRNSDFLLAVVVVSIGAVASLRSRVGFFCRTVSYIMTLVRDGHPSSCVRCGK